MRIIAGSKKGRRIELPKSADKKLLRPTSELVREALFSTLQSQFELEGCLVLDLFAGSGALGIEALSRGASRAMFVESSRKHAAAIKKNLVELELWDKSKLLEADAFKALEQAAVFLQAEAQCSEQAKLILADPPYADDLLERLLKALAEATLLTPNTMLVYEARSEKTSEGERFDCASLNLSPRLEKSRKYGDTRLYYFGF